jgi:ABC-2 type transport system ATP-binding protein
MDSIISVQNVSKHYGDYTAVNSINLELKKGCLFGLLGPNGAGKTSLIRMMTTITSIDEGQILFNGVPLNGKSPQYIGYMPEERGLYKKMKVGEQLLYLAQLKGMSKKEANEKICFWMERFEIMDWWSKEINELSKGMQQKIQFISTVVHEPELLILDEPFSGLDPINTNLIKSEIFRLKEKGTTIIFSTHRMEQVEEICEEIMLVNKGNTVLGGNIQDIRNTYKKNHFEIKTANPLNNTDNIPGTVLDQQGNTMIVHLENDKDSNELIKYFINKGERLISFKEILPSLNEIFIQTVESVA